MIVGAVSFCECEFNIIAFIYPTVLLSSLLDLGSWVGVRDFKYTWVSPILGYPTSGSTILCIAEIFGCPKKNRPGISQLDIMLALRFVAPGLEYCLWRFSLNRGV